LDGRLNCCWSSLPQSFLASDLVEIHDQDFCSLLHMYGFLFDEAAGRVVYVSTTVGSAGVHPQGQGVQFTVGSVNPCHCIVSWDTTPCSPLKVNRCSGGTCRLHLHGRRLLQAKKVSVKQTANRACSLLGLFSDPDDGGDMFFRHVG
jgi:hypothetical protein